MNERIKELAVEAGADIWGDNIVASQYVDMNKFAELIIAECSEFCGRIDRDVMLKHFGVK